MIKQFQYFVAEALEVHTAIPQSLALPVSRVKMKATLDVSEAYCLVWRAKTREHCERKVLHPLVSPS